MSKKNVGFGKSLCSIIGLSVALILFVIAGCEIHVPLVFGCALASVMALVSGYTWKEISESMISGIMECIEALLILIVIGMLIGVWIASGTIPALITFGLKCINPNLFFFTAFVISTLVSLLMGAWGTIGSIGIVFTGVASAMGIPAGAAVGAIVSGAYVGDKISPFSDSTNLAASVARVDVFEMIKKGWKPVLLTCIIVGAGYLALGMGITGEVNPGAETGTEMLCTVIEQLFNTNFTVFLPLFVMAVCVVLRVPSLPAMLVGVISGMAVCFAVQGCSFLSVMNSAVYGNAYHTGIQSIDELLNAGGILSMMNTVSIIMIAMAYGGIMMKTGQFDALFAPIKKKIDSVFKLAAVTELTCFLTNMILPDQYLGIVVPGQIYREKAKEGGLSSADFANVLGAGAAVTSPLIAWNTCGLYVKSLLGVSTAEYWKYSWLNLLFPIVMLLSVLRTEKRHGR